MIKPGAKFFFFHFVYTQDEKNDQRYFRIYAFIQKLTIHFLNTFHTFQSFIVISIIQKCYPIHLVSRLKSWYFANIYTTYKRQWASNISLLWPL